MTPVVVTPINPLIAGPDRESVADDFSDLLAALADLAVGARKQRERLSRLETAADDRVQQALEHLAALEQHAYDLGVEAARVRHEMQHARLI